MSLQLLLGPSGSGKTTNLYKRLIEEAERSSAFQAMAIVPEQYTMQTQKDLVLLHPRHSITNIDILSFDRLAYRILGELGVRGLTVLDDMGKLMVLRRAAGQCSDRLKVFRKNLDKAGFIDKIKSMLSELYQYRIDVRELDRLIGELDEEPLLQRKLQEIRTLYAAFDRSMEEDTIPSERLFDVLCRLIPQSRLIRDSVITFDGFTGFTPAQYQVLEMLMRYAKKVMVTVTMDTRPGCSHSRQQLFELSAVTADTLCRLAKSNGVAVEAPVVLEPGIRYGASPELAALERQLMCCPTEAYAGGEDCRLEHIHLWQVRDRQAEMEAVAREIFRLVRSGEVRYRDIAVISGDIGGYEPVIRRVFDHHGIPLFLDVKNNMMGHPLVAYLRGALEAVEKNYTYETIFACLKSGMSPLKPQEIYELENYVLALGIRGRNAWGEVWEHQYPEGKHLNMAELNRIRQQVAEPLFAMQEVLKQENSTVREYAEALVMFMQSQGVEERLQEMAKEIAEAGETSLGLEYEQAYVKVLELLDKVVDLFGDGHVSLREWREILDTGFGEIRVGVIPACVDRVVAGDMHRTRLKDPKVLFFVGANDGLVPQVGDKVSLLSDADRRSLAGHGVQLAPTRQENGFIDRFYLYLTLTKPSHRLYVSWCRQGMDGSAMNPSYLVGELRGIFPQAVTEHPDEQVEFTEQIVTRKTARSALLSGLAGYRNGEVPSAWKELYSLFLQEPDGKRQLEQWLDAAFLTYREESMGPAVARALYGDMLSGSVTRLEQYAACAYAQFLSYGLRLTERRIRQFAAADMGTLFHEVIRRFFGKVYGEHTGEADGSGEPAAMSPGANLFRDETRQALVRQCMDEAVAQGLARGLEGTARGDYLLQRVEKTADRTLWALCEQLSRGDFHPEEVEVEFDGKDSRAMNMMLDRDTVMRLHGRIDRVDVCENEKDEILVKVIDYKTGGTTFDLVGVYYGLQLQLVVYLDAAMERERRKHRGKTVIPAGILYYNIRDPFVAVDPSEAGEPDGACLEDGLLKELKMNGIVNRKRDIYRRLDRLVGTEAPPVIPVTEKDGLPVESRSSVADTGQLYALCDFVRQRMQEFGDRIMNGHMAVNPYMKGKRTGCDYCRFAAVCGFDKKTPGYDYRRLTDLETSELWERIKPGSEMSSESKNS